MDHEKSLFDYCIGNPPYQSENSANNRQEPVYNTFMDEAYKVADVVELITPARFLFNAGQTSKQWNEERLHDEHFKVLRYEADASKVFANTEIKGGVAVTLRNKNKDFGAIGIFTESEEMNTTLQKVLPHCTRSISDITVGAVPYHFTQTEAAEHPDWTELIGDSFDLRTNILDKMENKLFFAEKPEDGHDYVRIFGLFKKKRAYMWVDTRYITKADNFNGYKVFISKANGTGSFGEPLSNMVIAEPLVGHTQSFISVGNFATEYEAESFLKYAKSKFARALLSILRKTQDTTPYKWKYVPLQDFSSSSDIDWNKSIHEIDLQLYRKYGLDASEIDFIEKNVKEMK